VPKVRNASHGIYADGSLFVQPDEVVEVTEEQAKYLCDKTTSGKFERVKQTAKTDAEKEAERKAQQEADEKAAAEAKAADEAAKAAGGEKK